MCVYIIFKECSLFPCVNKHVLILQKYYKFRLKYRNKEYTQALQFLPHQRLEVIILEVSGRGKQINLIVLSDNSKKQKLQRQKWAWWGSLRGYHFIGDSLLYHIIF